MDLPLFEQEIPRLTTAQMVEVDRAMIEDSGIMLIQMMENAGRGLAHLARERFLDGDPRERSVAVLAGTGGNGGGALVCARRLRNWGARVEVYLTRPEAMTPVPAHQLEILRRMGVPIGDPGALDLAADVELIVDGVIGYSLKGPPRGAAATLIRWASGQPAPVLALDAPSGLDTTSGQAFEPSIRAAATMTLALPKAGLDSPAARDRTGELYLADISVPPELYASLALEVPPLFARGDVLRLR